MADELEEDFEESSSSEEDSDFHAAGPPRGGKKNKLLLILLPVLLIVGAIAAAFLTGVADPLLNKLHKPKAPPAEETAQAGVPQIGMVDLPPMLVNLTSPGVKQNYLKISITLQISNVLDKSKVIAIIPRIVDSFQVHMRELRIQDLQGSSSVQRLHAELLRRAQSLAKPANVTDVFFQEFLVQ